MRFKVGDLARVVVAMKPENLGLIIQIDYVGPFKTGDIGPTGLIHTGDWDYLRDGGKAGCYDWQLAPIDPAAEPESLTRSEEIENV